MKKINDVPQIDYGFTTDGKHNYNWGYINTITGEIVFWQTNNRGQVQTPTPQPESRWICWLPVTIETEAGEGKD